MSEIICHCMEVTEEEIISAIKEKGCDTVEKITEETDAGSGCGGCVERIEEILEANK